MKANATRFLQRLARAVFAGAVIDTADTEAAARAVAHEERDIAAVGEAAGLNPVQTQAAVRELEEAGYIATIDGQVRLTASGVRWWAARRRAGGV